MHKKSQQSKKEQKEAKAKAKKAEEVEKNTSRAEDNTEVIIMDVTETDKENDADDKENGVELLTAD